MQQVRKEAWPTEKKALEVELSPEERGWGELRHTFQQPQEAHQCWGLYPALGPKGRGRRKEYNKEDRGKGTSYSEITRRPVRRRGRWRHAFEAPGVLSGPSHCLWGGSSCELPVPTA